ncbi:MAG: hypothetical protein KA085_15370 [Phenylobacterium sp.]|jgi:hypothetical protein|uniref:hypothetical protein n=1 Tax=Phenylobacterium sp. TaxID=1871053 RepID=UPI001B5C9A22|nr:hypothetical protein [Phenylobacterium sp.]MBP7648435.1 hypothetical protein [Phenylobacterium sp.]MBP7817507.1 hypothetical protein [Phenylobacterium sp.]MBP9230243.1 hypothetical protein [Phenylobacterium sp.]MBP9753848.1 hypothetical protein [Phenylobacterium sp.]
MIALKPNESVTPAAALYVPIGAASPLWFMFTGAASAGVAYWWLTRWMAPVNLEALLPVSGADAEPAQEAAILVEAFLEPLLEAAEPVLAEGGVVDPDPAPVPAPEPAPNPLDTPPPQAAMQMAAPAIEPAAKIVARPSRSRPKTPPKG